MRSSSGWVRSTRSSKWRAPVFANQCAALDEISEAPYESHEHIDNALRSFLALTTLYKRTRAPLTYPAPSALTARREVPAVGA